MALGAFPERAASGRNPSTPARAQPAERAAAAEAREPATLDEVARIHIERVLSETLGRIDGPYGAAVRLRIHPNTLRARMRKLNIDWRRFRGGCHLGAVPTP